MNKNRLEAFSDGVLAIIITIMVLELHIPEKNDSAGLAKTVHELMAYLLSFVYIGIYWNNHHHLLHKAEKINGSIMWANLHLLFWLSLVPFTTRWMSETGYEGMPVAAYGITLMMAGTAYFILTFLLKKYHGKESAISRALGYNVKEIFSILMYLAGIISAFIIPTFSLIIFAIVAITWVIPDRRLERS